MKVVSFEPQSVKIKSIYDICGKLVLEFKHGERECFDKIELCELYNFFVCNYNDKFKEDAEYKLDDYQMPIIFELKRTGESNIKFERHFFDVPSGKVDTHIYQILFSDVLNVSWEIKNILIDQLGKVYNQVDVNNIIANNLEDVV